MIVWMRESCQTEECQEIGCNASEQVCGDLGAVAFAGVHGCAECEFGKIHCVELERLCSAMSDLFFLWFEDAS